MTPETGPAAIGGKGGPAQIAQLRALRLNRERRIVEGMDDLDVDANWQLLRALALMCEQYIGAGDGVDHECMTAGEEAVTQLV